MAAYMFKLDPAAVLDEPDTLRQKVRLAAVEVITRSRLAASEEMSGDG